LFIPEVTENIFLYFMEKRKQMWSLKQVVTVANTVLERYRNLR